MSKYGITNELYKNVTEVKSKYTRSVYIDQPYKTFSVDLIEMPETEHGHKYLFNCIDIFTKKVFSYPLRNKNYNNIKLALTKTFEFYGHKPQYIWSDQEGAIIGTNMQNWLKEQNITTYHTHGNVHNPVIERFNRTMKNSIQILMVNDRIGWIEASQIFVEKYNNTKHSFTNVAPNNATDHQSEIENKFRINANKQKTTGKLFNVGNKVRIRIKNSLFAKKSTSQKWSDEIFVIYKINNGNPPMYILKDAKGETIDGSFYSNELLLVNESSKLHD